MPPLKYWFSKLKHDDPSDEDTVKEVTKDYQYAKLLFNYFKCKNIKNYNVYVTSDVLVLSDVFISYRKRSYDLFGKDAFFSIALSGFSNRAVLKYNNQK